jgi:hypothetical protein
MSAGENGNYGRGENDTNCANSLESEWVGEILTTDGHGATRMAELRSADFELRISAKAQRRKGTKRRGG